MADVQALRDHVRDWGQRVARTALDQTYDDTLRAAPESTGNLKQKLQIEPISGDDVLTGTIINDAPYAAATDAGARPHVIRGNPFLAFYWEKISADVVFRFVNHPGFAGYNWFNGGEDGGEPMATRWRTALEEAAGTEQ